MRLAGSELVQTLFRFKHDGTIMMGDCGSLLIDHDTLEVYGHVVANSRRRGVAFILAAKPIFEALGREGDCKLLTVRTGDISHTDITLRTDDTMDLDTDSPIPLSNGGRHDPDVSDTERLEDWEFLKAQPKGMGQWTDNQGPVHQEETSTTANLGHSPVAYQERPMAQSTLGSLSSHGSGVWSLESPTYDLTAPSSLDDIDKLEQLDTTTIASDDNEPLQRPGNPIA